MSTATQRCAILVVEDEPAVRVLLVDDLTAAGFAPVEAEDADAALAELVNHPDISVVVTDVRIPGSVNGLGLARWMRMNRPSVPIIIISGFSPPRDIASINPAIAMVIAKPYEAEQLAGLLHEIVAAAGASTAPEGRTRQVPPAR